MSVPAVAAAYFAAGPFPATSTPLITSQFGAGGWRAASGRPVSHAELVALRGQGVIAVTLTAGSRAADFQLSELVSLMRPVDAAFADGGGVPDLLDTRIVRLCLFGVLESEHCIEVHADEPGWVRVVCRTHGTEHAARCRGYATEAAAIAGAEECDDGLRLAAAAGGHRPHGQPAFPAAD
jgi:hypothetical protein